MSKATPSDLKNAIDKWRSFCRRGVGPTDYFEFTGFIGHPHNPRAKGMTMIVDLNNPEICRLIDLINSPNGNVILAIMKAKRE